MNYAIKDNHQGVDKIARYRWVAQDTPGELKMLHKSTLRIEKEYQRDLIPEKVRSIASEWSWMALGALVVAERDGEFWTIDGQHRAVAANLRSDITYLPCVVFKTKDIKTEARSFINLNTGRKPVTAVAKQKALTAAGDEIAVFVQQQCEALDLQIKSTAASAGQLKCVAWCLRRAAENKEMFRAVLEFGAELCTKDHLPVSEKLLEGLWLINTRCGEGLADKRMAKRLRDKGARALIDAASRASSYYASGGGKVWALGMLGEINKGLQQKFTMDGVEA